MSRLRGCLSNTIWYPRDPLLSHFPTKFPVLANLWCWKNFERILCQPRQWGSHQSNWKGQARGCGIPTGRPTHYYSSLGLPITLSCRHREWARADITLVLAAESSDRWWFLRQTLYRLLLSSRMLFALWGGTQIATISRMLYCSRLCGVCIVSPLKMMNEDRIAHLILKFKYVGGSSKSLGLTLQCWLPFQHRRRVHGGC
jgi:hypothetical protein